MNDSNRVVRILIADDYALFRDALKKVLDADPGFLVVGEACNGEETLKQVGLLDPDILLLDWQMPKISDKDVLRSLSISGTRARTILLTAEIEMEQISELLEIGVRGLVLKESSSSVLFKSIRCVMAGQYWIIRDSFANLDETLNRSRSPGSKNKRPKNYGLTRRELEVIAAVVSGHTNREIAKQFSISEQTVKHHVTRIFDKLGVYNRLELTLFTLHHGLIDTSK
jgi:DNA-binding NarL/FixJ family response regulator